MCLVSLWQPFKCHSISFIKGNVSFRQVYFASRYYTVHNTSHKKRVLNTSNYLSQNNDKYIPDVLIRTYPDDKYISVY